MGMLCNADQYIFAEPSNPTSASSRHAILTAYCEYLEKQHPAGGGAAKARGAGPCLAALKPVLGLFNGGHGKWILQKNIDKLCRDPNLRSEGPGAILRNVITLLEADPKASQCLHE